MQALYGAINTNENWTVVDAKKLLNVFYKNAKQLTVAYLELTKQVLEYSIIDATNRKAKHLPSAADLNVNTTSSLNTLVADLNNNDSFKKAVVDLNVTQCWEIENVKKLYQEFAALEVYTNYIENESPKAKDHIELFENALEIVTQSEDVDELLEDANINIDDDKEMVALWIVKNENNLKSHNFADLLSRDKHNFGIDLIDTVAEKYDYTLELIKPKLNNWDPERIAKLDMLIMQMGIVELIYFPHIPTKVSINEYIDLAKLYSTKQSGQFVNGVIDKIHKELLKNNKIEKIPLERK